ncbi:MAG: 1,4-alpha-glucan branching protein GlgB [candidate division KSB1 bacterium]|nr:1,4-alpha-glucan branching protein GlgB [candidate division KSB1 bacterium]MDZ7300535.1 1,4-alpha-glucan branching protein GlgB [candidate division KSB1 bacterium]MDZ7309674.1 1,4-alpha-glucan branching protein GlgB [candidate division KSB1 bacterium]
MEPIVSPTSPTIAYSEISKIVHGDHGDPFAVLGMHAVNFDGKTGMAVRAFLPQAQSARVVEIGKAEQLQPMTRIENAGFFEAIFPGRPAPFRYQIEITDTDGNIRRFEDPYRFLPVLGELDLYLFGEGNHLQVYEKLGAHVMTIDGVAGVHFAVWAPNARRVSVIGNFNNWDGRRHPMRLHPGVGVWEIFIPGLGEGELYRYEIKTQHGVLRIKTDPYAFRMELRPSNASIVQRIDDFSWHDEKWLEQRRSTFLLERPLAIYEVHLGSWRRKVEENNRHLNYRELAHELVPYVTDMGFTHVELLPVMEHPFDPSWGYQVTGYYAPTARYGAPEDFAYFVDYLHQHNIGVILDWVPAHFPRDDYALRWFDGTALYEHADPRLGEHPDWGTLVFNYGRNEVRNFLLANAVFWCDKYHVDGLRVDAVASMLYLDYSRKEGEWLPNRYGGRENLEAIDFLKRFNEVVHERFPGVMVIAEESTAWPAVSRPTYLGGLGFTFKWNMGWMNDFLRYMHEDPVHRKYHHHLITFSMLYAFTENFILVLSHDEVVHGKGALLDKMPGDFWQRFANLRAALGYMYGHPGKKLLFMGGEFGQWWEWNHAESIHWHLLQYEPHQKLQQYVKDLNRLYRSEPALYEVDYSWEGFQWIDFQDKDASLVSFFRRGKNPNEVLVFACNFTPVPRVKYRIGLPLPGFYREVLNSDSEHYWGSNMGNEGGVMAEELPWHNQPYSAEITFPPLAVVVFKRAEKKN